MAPSGVCPGLGVFATRAVPSGTVMTAYPFVQLGKRCMRRARDKPDDDYMYLRSDGATIDGHPRLLRSLSFLKKRRTEGRRERHLWGHANLANDAIHPELTGRTNNCDFVEPGASTSGRMYLVTSRAVRAGEELLVPYSLGYWMSRAGNTAWSPKMRGWLECHTRVRDALRPLIAELHEYVSVTEEADGGSCLEYIASYTQGCTCRCPCVVVARIIVRWHPSGDDTIVATCKSCACRVTAAT